MKQKNSRREKYTASEYVATEYVVHGGEQKRIRFLK